MPRPWNMPWAQTRCKVATPLGRTQAVCGFSQKASGLADLVDVSDHTSVGHAAASRYYRGRFHLRKERHS